MAGQRYRAFIVFIVAMAYWGLLAQCQAALNVIVYDSRNQPVNSLSINDFQVYDQNKLRQIVFLRRDDVTQKPTASGPDQYSNRTGKAAFHATVILFDLLNLSGSDGNDALTRLVSSIQSESSGNLYFYFLTATGGIEPVHGLPQTETDVGETGTTWAQQIRPRFNQAQHAVADINARAEMTYRAVGRTSYGSPLVCLPKPWCRVSTTSFPRWSNWVRNSPEPASQSTPCMNEVKLSAGWMPSNNLPA
jgi:hypothetical protein